MRVAHDNRWRMQDTCACQLRDARCGCRTTISGACQGEDSTTVERTDASTGVQDWHTGHALHLQDEQCSGTEHHDSHDSYWTSSATSLLQGLHIEHPRHLQYSH